MPRFSANLTFLFTELPFLDRFAAAADAGFAAVEFAFPYGESPEAVGEAVGRAGVEAVLFNAPPGDWASGERGLAALRGRSAHFRASLDRAFDYAEATKAWLVHCMAGIASPGDELADRIYCENLRHVCEAAGERGLTIVIEPINARDMPGYWLSRTAQAERIIGELALPNLGLLHDFYHAQIMDGDLSATLERVLPIVRHVQIANPPARNEPGFGEINYDHLFTRLDALGYDGWVGCEYVPSGTTLDSLGWRDAWVSR